MTIKSKVISLASALLIGLSIAGGTNAKADSLASKNYQSGSPAYINVNGGKSTLNGRDWKYVHIDYSKLDHLNRASGGNTAYLDSRNVANDSLRESQRFVPTGWHQKKTNHGYVVNRGHEIAYSLSKGINVNGKYSSKNKAGDQDNPKNLFTQSAYSNQRVQTIFETKVRDALRDGYKVIYRVQPVFQGNDLMAKGVHMQAISTNGKLNFNVYLFNVQPNITFNYANGRSKVSNLQVANVRSSHPTSTRTHRTTSTSHPTRTVHKLNTSSNTSNNDDNTKVWIATKSGTKYHFLNSDKYKSTTTSMKIVTLKWAKEHGYTQSR